MDDSISIYIDQVVALLDQSIVIGAQLYPVLWGIFALKALANA